MSYLQIWRRYLTAHWPKVALLAISLFSGIFLQLYAPQIVRTFIDAAASGAAVAELVRLALAFLAVALVNQLLAALSTYLSADVGWSATNALRTDLFRHALSLDMAYHKERTPGELIERIDGDATHLSNFFSQFVVRVAGSLLLVVGILGLLWWEDWRVGLALTVYVVVVTALLHKRRGVAVPATQMEREANAQLYGFIEERLAGIDDIRASGAGRYVMHRFLKVQRDWFHKTVRAWRLRVGIWLLMMSLSIVGHVLALGLGVGLFLSGAITLGTVYLIYNYMNLLEDPLDELSRQLQEFQRAAAGFRRVRELLAERPRIVGGSRALGPGAPAVEFENVSFAYDGDHYVLKGISFRLEAGESLGLLGRTGGGKTTLIRLLYRFYDPSVGRILVDGVDLREFDLKSYRARIGLVTQEVQLFEGTVRDNLTFFDPSITDERLYETFAKLGLESWLASLPAGLDTPLTAGGSGLSAGESQLLAFARVFLQDPGVVILDEPSARLDPATEALLTRAIERLLKGRTAIVIAHRLATVQRLDKIMVLSQGRIAEFGDRRALAADPSSLYSAMLALSADGPPESALEAVNR